MSEIKLNTALTMEEIADNFQDVNFFEGVTAGLNEALAYEKGTAKAETIARKRSLPDVNVAEVRNSLSLTQKSLCRCSGCFFPNGRSMGMWQVHSDPYRQEVDVPHQSGSLLGAKTTDAKKIPAQRDGGFVQIQ